MGLGSLRDVSIQKAREKALLYRQALNDGHDPITIRKQDKSNVSAVARSIKTVSEVTDEWFNDFIAPRAPGYARKIENQLNKYVHPTIGDMLISTVGVNVITDGEPGVAGSHQFGLKALREKYYPTGNDMRMYLERIFKVAIRRGYYTGKNPAAWEDMLEDVLPEIEHKRKQRRAVPFRQGFEFLQDLRAVQDRSVRNTGHPTLAYVLEWLFFCGVRLSEALLAQYKEIDRKTMTWNVPPEHRKQSKKKRSNDMIRPIPITPSMLKVLDAMAERRLDASDDALIFPSDRNGHCIKTSSPATFVRRNLPQWKIEPHGFRSTLLDWVIHRGNKGATFEWWKLQTDHQIGSGADTHYGEDMGLEERRGMMLLYDAFFQQAAPAEVDNVDRRSFQEMRSKQRKERRAV